MLVSLQSPPVTAGPKIAEFFSTIASKLFARASSDQLVWKYIQNAFRIYPLSQISAGDSICEKERNLQTGQVISEFLSQEVNIKLCFCRWSWHSLCLRVSNPTWW